MIVSHSSETQFTQADYFVFSGSALSMVMLQIPGTVISDPGLKGIFLLKCPAFQCCSWLKWSKGCINLACLIEGMTTKLVVRAD